MGQFLSNNVTHEYTTYDHTEVTNKRLNYYDKKFNKTNNTVTLNNTNEQLKNISNNKRSKSNKECQQIAKDWLS